MKALQIAVVGAEILVLIVITQIGILGTMLLRRIDRILTLLSSPQGEVKR